MKQWLSGLVLVVFSLTLVECGQRGSPSGGPKDITGPQLDTVFPANRSINFTGQKIVFKFNEYFKLQSFYTEFLISPPVPVPPKAKIVGQKLILEFDSAFRPNTTYNLFFGKAVTDITEGNVWKENSYVFSTGPVLDSLELEGNVWDAQDLTPFKSGMVHLYKNINDSAPITQIPTYFGPIKDGHFHLQCLASGEYKIFALVDANSNYKYDLPNEQIAFLEGSIKIPHDTAQKINLSMFEKKVSVQGIKMKKMPYKTMAILTFNQPVKSLLIETLQSSKKLDWLVYDWAKPDSLVLWNEDLLDQEELLYEINYDGILDTLKFYPADAPPISRFNYVWDATQLENVRPTPDTLAFYFPQPIRPFKIPQFKIIRDSVEIPFEWDYSKNGRTLYVWAQFEDNKFYTVKANPNAFIGKFGGSNKDTLVYHFNALGAEKFGALNFNYDCAAFSENLLLEIYRSGQLVKTEVLKTKTGVLKLKQLEPGNYTFKIIADQNGDGEWTSGEYETLRQPEKIYWMDESIDIRANWEMDIEWLLKP